jgi:transcriptional regulator with XRE-family HTH domain
MKTQLDTKNVIRRGFISDEIEFERVLIIYRKLRLVKENRPELAESFNQLRVLIQNYEEQHWNNETEITEDRINESDTAEFLAEQERLFLQHRKELIKTKLKAFDLNQQDLGVLLGHTKSYISELMNGIHPFSNKDLIIIHRIFGIKLEALISTMIPPMEQNRLKDSLAKINKPNFYSKLKTKNQGVAFLFL